MNRNVLVSGLVVIVVGLASLKCPSQAIADHAVWCGPCVCVCCEPCCTPCVSGCCWGPVILQRPCLFGGCFVPAWGFCPCGIGCCGCVDCCTATYSMAADCCTAANGSPERVAHDVVQASVSTPAPRTATPASFKNLATSTSGDARLDIRVPADAKVLINDHATTSVGEERRYVSQGLKRGAKYRYEVRAEIVRDGRTISQTKIVQLGANQRTDMVFDLSGPKFASAKR